MNRNGYPAARLSVFLFPWGYTLGERGFSSKCPRRFALVLFSVVYTATARCNIATSRSLSPAVPLDDLLADDLDRPDVVRPHPLGPCAAAAAAALLLQGDKPVARGDEDTPPQPPPPPPTTTTTTTDDHQNRRPESRLPSYRLLRTINIRVKLVSVEPDKAGTWATAPREGEQELMDPVILRYPLERPRVVRVDAP